jgi:hypothetical protein
MKTLNLYSSCNNWSFSNDSGLLVNEFKRGGTIV